jgi:hypothetical protein
MPIPVLPAISCDLATAIRGVWWLERREDWTQDGLQKIDPVLGADPFGILAYGVDHFSAQFMKRDRRSEAVSDISYSGKNNTVAVGGYDAYFGTYEVDQQSGKVRHTLIGSITPSNTGITVYRNIRADDMRLIIQLETTTPDGEPIIRTLTWKRIG